MTRFARAKGSKASNERVAEEATPWSELKQQLLEKNKEIEENQKRKEAIEKRTANYKAFLEEKEKDSIKNSSWAEFPGSQNPSTRGNPKKVKQSTTIKSHKQKNAETPSEQEENNNLKQNTVSNSVESDSDEPPEEQSSKMEIVEPVVIKKKKAKPNKLLKITLEADSKGKNRNQDEDTSTSKKRKAVENVEGKQKRFKKGKNNEDSNGSKNEKIKQNKKIVKENLTERDLKKIEKKKQKRIKQVEKKKRVKALKAQKQKEEMEAQENGDTKPDGENQGETPNQFKSFEKSVNGSKHIKENRKKVRDNKEHPRKKPFLPHKMFINGKELEIDYVDGFPVKKEDAVRLKKLRREMISKGLPRSEINIALKLERRKAEKAFVREKKKVCFHCRMSGHNLSECPSLDKNDVAQTAASGICFKCGSTEHTHFECKVIRGQEFKYATCFICKEQGHIARQCPDNARGLYPKGGACKVCGDVTHLKKDCPTYHAQQQKQEENMRVETLSGSNPDILEEKFVAGGGSQNNKKPNKIIKF